MPKTYFKRYNFECYVPLSEIDYPETNSLTTKIITAAKATGPTIAQMRTDYADTVTSFYATEQPDITFPAFNDIRITDIILDDFDSESLIYSISFTF